MKLKFWYKRKKNCQVHGRGKRKILQQRTGRMQSRRFEEQQHKNGCQMKDAEEK
jgi:hypothetical protein